MRRRNFIAGIAGSAAAWPLTAGAQQPAGKVWRIGMLETTSAALNAGNFDAFRKALREHGYVEGQNLVIEYLSADGRPERFPALAADLVRLKVDLIVTRGTPAALAGQECHRDDSCRHGGDRRTRRGRRRGKPCPPGRKYHGVQRLCH